MDMPATTSLQPLAHGCGWRWPLSSGSAPSAATLPETVFRDIWQGGGQEAADADRLAALGSLPRPTQREPGGDAVKAQLKANTDEAIARGVFGVPAFIVDGRLVWGFDALPMLRAALLRRYVVQQVRNGDAARHDCEPYALRPTAARAIGSFPACMKCIAEGFHPGW